MSAATTTQHKGRHGSESEEMYLETILVLQNEKSEGVHAVDIARRMGFSKPTVSEYLKKLRKRGLVTVNEESHVALTEEGRRIANGIYDRHTVISEMFKMLGISPEVATEDACRIEHYISDETFQHIKQHYLKYRSQTSTTGMRREGTEGPTD